MSKPQEHYIGKYLLVGLTYLEKDESVREQIQIHGKIIAISDTTIVFKRNDNGKEFSIPFDEDNLNESDPELVYELKSTGEAIEGINYTSSWTIHPPEDEDSKNNL